MSLFQIKMMQESLKQKEEAKQKQKHIQQVSFDSSDPIQENEDKGQQTPAGEIFNQNDN